jgi:flagellin
MVINTNTSAIASASNLQLSEASLARSLARLSSGSKIVNPSDDAAGVAVASRLDAQVQRLAAARSNVGNATSFTQTQDGYLKKIAKALDRMSELSILAMDGTKTDADRTLYNAEFATLKAYVTDAATKEFNGVPLFSSDSREVTTDGDGAIFVMNGIDLGVEAYTNATGDASAIDTSENAKTALQNVKAAITQLSTDRATIGAYQVRLSHTADQLTISKENLVAASSRIQDVDMAEESTNYAHKNILVQAGTAMLAQANQMPQGVLRLLQ